MITILLQKILDLLRENLANMIKFFVTDPQEGQTLVYDAESEEWKNDYVEIEMQETASGAIATFETDATLPLVSLKANITATQSGTGTPSPSNPRAIIGFSSVTLTQKDSEDNTVDTFTIALGDTYYGGVLDCNNGTATITHGYADLGDLSWNYNSGTKIFYAVLSSNPKTNGDCISDIYERINLSTLATDQTKNEKMAVGWIVTSNCINIRNTDYTDANTFKTAMSGHQLVYELATPITLTGLTPDNFTTIQGENNIFADSGDVEVIYNTSSAQKVWDVANLVIDITDTVTVNTTDFSSVSYKVIRTGNVVMISLYSATVVNSSPAALFTGLPKSYNNVNVALLDTVSGDVVPGSLSTAGALGAAAAEADQRLSVIITYIIKDEV